MKKISKIIQEIDISITNLKFFENSLALKYQEISKYDKFSFLQERERIVFFSNPLMVERAVKPYKTYPSKQQIPLGTHDMSLDENDLLRLIKSRRSRRNFLDYNISINELHKILYYGYGITGKAKIRGDDDFWYYRAVPSGGALYPLELYIYINKSMLEQGLYHYRPDKDSLEYISEKVDINDIQKNIAAENVNMKACSCMIFITSVFQRNMLKYGERGYRFILQEVGAVLQNISLICENMNLASCILGGYVDDAINNFLGINPPLETIQGIIIIGKVE